MSELTDEQRGLRDAVRALLAKRSDSAAVRRAVDETDAATTRRSGRCCASRSASPRWPCPSGSAASAPAAARCSSCWRNWAARSPRRRCSGRRCSPPRCCWRSATTTRRPAAAADRGGHRRRGRVGRADGDWGSGAVDVDGDRLSGEAHYVLDGDTPKSCSSSPATRVYEVDPSRGRAHAHPDDGSHPPPRPRQARRRARHPDRTGDAAAALRDARERGVHRAGRRAGRRRRRALR